MSDSDRPTSDGPPRDTVEMPRPPDFDDEPARETWLPPESAVIMRPRGLAAEPMR